MKSPNKINDSYTLLYNRSLYYGNRKCESTPVSILHNIWLGESLPLQGPFTSRMWMYHSLLARYSWPHYPKIHGYWWLNVYLMMHQKKHQRGINMELVLINFPRVISKGVLTNLKWSLWLMLGYTVMTSYIGCNFLENIFSKYDKTERIWT